MKIIEATLLMPMTILLTLTLIVMSVNIYVSLERKVEYHKEETYNSYFMSLSGAVSKYDGIKNVIQ